MADDIKQAAIKQGFPAQLYDLFVTGGAMKDLARYFVSSEGMAREEAEDLVHDVAIQAIRRFDESKQPDDLKAWLWVLARHRLVDHLRKRHSHEVHLDDVSWLSLAESLPDSSTSTVALQSKVEAAFQKFELAHPERAKVLRLSIENWTISEIAGFLGRTEAATREYLYQSRKAFRPYVAGLLEDLRDVG